MPLERDEEMDGIREAGTVAPDVTTIGYSD
jgi:hypothetical protein